MITPTDRRIDATSRRNREESIQQAVRQLRSVLQTLRGVGTDFIQPLQVTSAEREVLRELANELRVRVDGMPEYKGALL